MLSWDGKIIHVDPYGRLADYSELPKADLVLITHDHGDHLDAQALAAIRKANTDVLLTEKCRDRGIAGEVMKNGDINDLQPVGIPWC